MIYWFIWLRPRFCLPSIPATSLNIDETNDELSAGNWCNLKQNNKKKRIHFDIVQKSAVNLRVVSSNMTITSQNVNKYKIWKIIQLETEYCTKKKKVERNYVFYRSRCIFCVACLLTNLDVFFRSFQFAHLFISSYYGFFFSALIFREICWCVVFAVDIGASSIFSCIYWLKCGCARRRRT